MTTQDLSSNRLSIVATFLSFLIALSYPSAAWATLQEPGNYVTKDGSEFFQKLCDAVCNWNDYSCQSELDTFKADKTVHSRCKFYYKKGHQVRIEITGSGFRSGTVIVRQTDGSITVHGGAMLGGMRMNLDPDSRMLILPNGNNCTKSDLPELMSKLKDELAHGWICRVTSNPINCSDIPASVYVLEVFESSAASAPLRKRIFIGADGKTPIRWNSYQDGKLFCTGNFKNLQTNVGLSDDLFRL